MNDFKQHARAFIAFQASQPEGLPSSKAELEKCYSYFCSLHQSSSSSSSSPVPQFIPVLVYLKKAHVLRCTRLGDEITYSRKVVVDHTTASRTAEKKGSSFRCDLCKCNCTDQQSLTAHFGGMRHRAALKVHDLKGKKDEHEKDRNNISITAPSAMEFGKLQHGTKHSRVITISNTGLVARSLTACELVKRSNGLTLSDLYHVSKGENRIMLPPRTSYEFTLECDAFNLGWIRDILIFRFESFNILRYISIEVVAEGAEELAPIAPYRPPPKVADEIPATIIPGIAIPSVGLDGLKPIGQYPIPHDLIWALNNGNPPPLGELSYSNYIKYFTTLLHFEEIQMGIDIRRYDRVSPMTKHGSYIVLEVPGLAENRPSLLVGDSVFVSEDQVEYQGVVHMVDLEKVLLRFAFKFHNTIFEVGKPYKIRFSFKRTPLRRMHQAIHYSKNISPLILYPQLRELDPSGRAKTQLQILAGASALRPINRNINTQQARAVAAILCNSSGQCPYIIFGPPGTGKTMTLVEAIGQVYLQNPKARILACAPSNTAADLIVERLMVLQKRHMFRFNAYNRRKDLVPEKVLEHSKFDNGVFVTPTKEFVDSCKVVVSTCVSAAVLFGLDVLPFTHVFIDEAGQAMEPEALVSISGLVTLSSQIILAGDPEQLGPVIRSPYAISKNGEGLTRSLLGRLISRHIYRWDPIEFAGFGSYDVQFITKLVNNYRSHPEILALPNELFYHNELVPMADVALRSQFCQWEELPTKGFPIIFHGTEGVDEREGNSPSWFNVAEVLQVHAYIKKLQESRIRVSLADVGVITPYRKQAEKLRRMLGGRGYGGVKVGSVEEFQGQERLIIIISCVRSTSEHVNFDLQHNLGFLKNPKRFNVAITRAQALLIVVGNPNVLIHDPNWRRFIEFCRANHAHKGCALPPPVVDESVNRLMDVFERLHIGEEENGDGASGMSLVEGREGPEWRTY